ncbi:MAG: winged helix-turn-helix domain-containing protein [Candidatus Verstraetearchaeota archaeon]|jgi:DNA-binding IclR family transcriptional regulator|nr:winged helix-turn-helix domain-containing protein [Candidatus Verstraetearchaeota archaeon]
MRTRYGKPAREMILELLKKENRPMKVREIVEKTGVNYNTVRGRLQDLKREGLVEATSEGWVLK